MSKKRIKSESISVAHKKRKNFLILIVILAFVFILVASFVSFFIDSNKAYREKRIAVEKKENSTEYGLNNKKEYKEDWAISVENRIDGMEQIVENGVKANQKSFQRELHKQNEKMTDVLEELKDVVAGSQSKTNKKIADMQKSIDRSGINSNEKVERLASDLKRVYSDIKKVKKVLAQQQGKISNISTNGSRPARNVQPINTNPLLPNITNNQMSSGDGAGVLPPPMLNMENILENPSSVSETVEGQIIPKSAEPQKVSLFVEDVINEKVVKAFPLVQKEEPSKEKEEKTFQLGIGMFRAFMVTGAYAPLFGENAESSSVPVLLEATGDIVMANDYYASVDKCFLIGGAIGNPSSNTVDIRLSSFECILNDGTHRIKGKMKGWVIGQNGKPGVPAELIHKSGEYISRFILSGLMEQMSQAFVNASTTSGTTQNPTTIITGGAQNGAATGAQNAFGKLSEFYMQLAEKTLPMLETKAGQDVAIMISTSETYKLEDFSPLNSDNIDDYTSNSKGLDYE